jgi:DNA polymerase (family 10)
LKRFTAIAKPIAVKRFKRPFAEAEATGLVDWLRPSLEGGRIVVAGSFRRRRDTVGDLDVLATSANAAAVGDKLARYENVARVVAHGPTRTTVVLRSGLQVDLRVVKEESYGAALLYFTGSKAHNIALRNIAVDRGWKLNEYGLFSKTKSIAGATEAGIYKKLALQFVPPELREDRGEIALARKNALPNLVQLAHIRGDLHVHSNWSDGNVPIAEMAQAAQARGYEYMALTDHSRRVTVAHGLDRARLLRQIKEVDRLNARMRGFTVLKGVEVDILADGELDLPDEVLSRLDVVVAAVHYKFDLSREKQTERVLRAFDNPRVSILAHPTGRLIEERPPYELDLERIMMAAKERGCALEINAEPDRLDLTDVAAKAAKELGVRIAISTDAHSIAALDYMRFGIDQARRGWLEPDDVINTRSLAELNSLLRR